MNTRPKKVIMYLISLEMKKRQAYHNSMGKIPKTFSNNAIAQMRKIVEMKRLPDSERQEILAEIKTFELITK